MKVVRKLALAPLIDHHIHGDQVTQVLAEDIEGSEILLQIE